MSLSFSDIYINSIANPNLGIPQKWAMLGELLQESGHTLVNLARGYPGTYSLKNSQHIALREYSSRRIDEIITEGYRSADDAQVNKQRLALPLQKLLGIEIAEKELIPIQRGIAGIYQIAHCLDQGLVFMSLPGYPNWIQAINEVKSNERSSFYHHTEKRPHSGSSYGVNTLGTANFDFDIELLSWHISRAKAAGEKVSALLLLYMHNPRGTKLERDLDKIATLAKDNPGMAVIVDAAYMNDCRLEYDEDVRGGEYAPDKTKNSHSPLASLINHNPEIRNQLVILSPVSKMADFHEGGGAIICPNPKLRQRLLSKRYGEAPEFGISQASIELSIGVFNDAAAGGIAKLSQHYKPILERAVKRAHQLGLHPGHAIDGGYYLMCWVDCIGTMAPELKHFNGRVKVQTDEDLCLYLALHGVAAMPVVGRSDRMGTGLIRLTATNEKDLNRGLDVIAGLKRGYNAHRAPWENGWSPSLTPEFSRTI